MNLTGRTILITGGSAGNQERVRVVEGDVLDLKTLGAAVAGQNVVYANLSGQMEEQAKNIVKAMNARASNG